MLDCWQVSPQRRPTFIELSQHLTKLFSDDRVSGFAFLNFDRNVLILFYLIIFLCGCNTAVIGSCCCGIPASLRKLGEAK